MRIRLDSRIDAMKDRIACEQRLRQRVIGQIFCSPDGEFPEGEIEKQFKEAQANDTILQALLAEEAGRERELVRIVEGLKVYQKVFAPIDGCGPLLASRIIGDVQDIRRFKRMPRFRAYCGVHVQTWWKCANPACGYLAALKRAITPKPEACDKCGGTKFSDFRQFPRRRNSRVANWQDEARKAYWLLASSQFNKRPNTPFGRVLRAAKVFFRRQHEKVQVAGKWVYSDAHIHKMGIWRSASIVADQIYLNWWALFGGAPDEEAARTYHNNCLKRLASVLPREESPGTDEGEEPRAVKE